MKHAVIKTKDYLYYAGNEALNTICSNISFSKRDMRRVVMTSCDSGEGKSFMVMQIANNMVKRGKRVVIVDADLRRSFLISRYGIETDNDWRGLAHYLAGYSGIDDILYDTNVPGLFIVPAGRDVANPIALLDSHYFADLMQRLSDNFDLVIVDAPPVGLVIDAAEIAQYCDGVIFVVEYNKTHKRNLKEAYRQIKQTGCPMLGCIINKVTFESISAKKYYNKSYYSHYGDAYKNYRRYEHTSKADDRSLKQ